MIGFLELLIQAAEQSDVVVINQQIANRSFWEKAIPQINSIARRHTQAIFV